MDPTVLMVIIFRFACFIFGLAFPPWKRALELHIETEWGWNYEKAKCYVSYFSFHIDNLCFGVHSVAFFEVDCIFAFITWVPFDIESLNFDSL